MAGGEIDPQLARERQTDITSTLEYGHSHRLARQVLVGSLFGIALGLLLLISLDGRDTDGKQKFFGGVVLAASLALIGVAIFRRMQPNKPSIVISRAGVLYRDVSEVVIPWSEIKTVGYDHVSHVRDLTSTKVVKLEVSPAFYQKYSRGRWLDSVIGINGDPAAIYISYYHSLPVDEAHDEIMRRWQYYTRQAGSLYSDADLARPLAEPAARASAASPRTNAIRSASSAGASNALASLIKEQSLGERAATSIALTAIAALLTNASGVWSTAAQVRNRASSAEWKAKMQQFDADMKASDEEQRKSRVKWDAISKCMQDMGTAREDRNCMDKIK